MARVDELVKVFGIMRRRRANANKTMSDGRNVRRKRIRIGKLHGDPSVSDMVIMVGVHSMFGILCSGIKDTREKMPLLAGII